MTWAVCRLGDAALQVSEAYGCVYSRHTTRLPHTEALFAQLTVSPRPSPLLCAYLEHAMGTQLLSTAQFFTLLHQHVKPDQFAQLTVLLPLAVTFAEYLPVCVADDDRWVSGRCGLDRNTLGP